ncbi:hypothetical protein [Lysinibacillus fusiformis]|uniref:hypothetical protein n=1 Tax=Lysinibacillus fusiformis TaxID=28031 RepID=UPI003CFFA41C
MKQWILITFALILAVSLVYSFLTDAFILSEVLVGFVLLLMAIYMLFWCKVEWFISLVIFVFILAWFIDKF